MSPRFLVPVLLWLPCVTSLRLEVGVSQPAGWAHIQGRFPELPPDEVQDRAVREVYTKYSGILSFGNEGREVLDHAIVQGAAAAAAEGQPYLMMEIGVWLGASLGRWLKLHPNILAVGVDPFVGPDSHHSKVKSLPLEVKRHFDNTTFLRRLAKYVSHESSGAATSRCVLIPGFSPGAAAPVLADPSVKISAFYIDGGKQPNKTAFTLYMNESLHSFHQHNPDALLSGDDWRHPETPTLQGTLKAFAAKQGLQLAQAGGRTWMMARNLSAVTKGQHLTWVVKDPSSLAVPSVEELLAKLKR